MEDEKRGIALGKLSEIEYSRLAIMANQQPEPKCSCTCPNGGAGAGAVAPSGTIIIED